MAYEAKLLTLKNAKIIKRNFRGEIKNQYDKGDRTCLVVLDQQQAEYFGYSTLPEFVEALIEDQWVVKWFKPGEDGSEPDAYMPVKAVFFRNQEGKEVGPNIFIKSGSGSSTKLTSETVGSLDYAEIVNIEICLQKHYYDYAGKQGYNNRIRSMEVEVFEDDITARNSRYITEDEIPFEE